MDAATWESVRADRAIVVTTEFLHVLQLMQSCGLGFKFL